jgi:hypothetical protein
MDRHMGEPTLARFQEALVVMNDVFIAGEDEMESYIIRIYHRDGKDPKKVAGVVEEIGKEGKRGFLDLDSLWRILTTPSRKPMPEKMGLTREKIRKDGRNDTMTFIEILKEINNDDE